MSKQVKINTTYNEYLNSLKKEDIYNILNFYNIKFKKNLSKEKSIALLEENLESIVSLVLGVFQNDELINIKYLIKKKGYIELRLNRFLQDFLDNLSDKHLVIKLEEKKFFMPQEVLKIFSKKVSQVTILNNIKTNTAEYNLLLGFVDAYGVIDFDQFYHNYSKNYKYKPEEALERIKLYSTFFNEFKVFSEKKKNYITSNIIENLKDCKKYLNKKENYKIYTNEELCDIHSFKYMESIRSYKKLIKYIKSTYDVSKNSTKIINKRVFIPYLNAYQIDKNVAKEKLAELINNYFEIKKEKQLNKFVELTENMAMDYPSWRLNGFSEKEHV